MNTQSLPHGIIKAEDAAKLLKTQAVGIGEDHTDPTGRKLAIALIEQGAVKHLFVEAAFWFQETMDTTIKDGILKEGWDEEKAVKQMLGYIKEQFDNPVTTFHVIYQAIKHGVAVHLADNPQLKQTGARNKKTQQVFVEATTAKTAAEAPGSLLLGGAFHFHCGASSLVNLIPGLLWVMLCDKLEV